MTVQFDDDCMSERSDSGWMERFIGQASVNMCVLGGCQLSCVLNVSSTQSLYLGNWRISKDGNVSEMAIGY
jgi:hypothetical protein